MMYKDYSQAYLDIMDSDPTTQSYNQFLHLGQHIDSSNEERVVPAWGTGECALAMELMPDGQNQKRKNRPFFLARQPAIVNRRARLR